MTWIYQSCKVESCKIKCFAPNMKNEHFQNICVDAESPAQLSFKTLPARRTTFGKTFRKLQQTLSSQLKAVQATFHWGDGFEKGKHPIGRGGG